MITKQKLDKMDQCRHLLDAPAPEVCGELIEEIRRLTSENERLRGVVRKFVEDYLNISWGNDGDCGATRLVNALDCDINESPVNVPAVAPATLDSASPNDVMAG